MTADVAFPVFGTTGVLIVTEPAALARARAIADAQLAAVDLACSRFRPDSELSRLNQALGELTHVSELFATLIAGGAARGRAHRRRRRSDLRRGARRRWLRPRFRRPR
jgi:FAD:protein FMN transferase